MGWIKIDRQITENWVWLDKKCRAAAWIDLIIRASHDERDVMFNKRPFHIKRGQFITSIRHLAKDWGWNKDMVRRFLEDLEKTEMIVKDSATIHATVLTIVNYDKFQSACDNDRYTDKDNDRYKHRYNDRYKDTTQSRNKEYKNKRSKEEERTIVQQSYVRVYDDEDEEDDDEPFDFEDGTWEQH